MSNAPDIAGEIIGWRSWYVSRRWLLEPPRLTSLNDTKWPRRGWLVAECEDGGDVPHGKEDGYGLHHRCGVHAARDREHLVGIDYTDWPGYTVVIGEVALAGKVIPGDMGWRAAKARPLRLWVAHLDWRLARPLSDAYHVPVGVTNILKEADAWN